MSIAELKETADKLSAKERTWLRAYLEAKARSASPVWKAEMAQRLKRLRAGRGVTEAAHRRFSRGTASRASASAR